MTRLMEQIILEKPLVDYHLGKAFNQTSANLNFKTLKDIIAIEPMQMIERPGFTYTWLGDLAGFLSKHKMLHLLQPLPGQQPVTIHLSN